jgi:outer membrane protein TolC
MRGHPLLLRAFWFGTLLGTAVAVAGCAGFSPDAGMSAVNAVVAPALREDAVKLGTHEDVAAARARTQQLLKLPLNAETAVRIALLNNRGLQAAYNELGIAEAVMVEASLPPSPTVSVSRVSTPVELDVERRIVADILSLATLPARADIAVDRFRQAQLRAAEETLRVAMEARRSYYNAVAAREIVAALGDALAAADTAAKLAKELAQTGAMNKLDQAREEAFHADLLIRLATARDNAATARERLIRAMGVADTELNFRLPRTLAPLPRKPRSLAAAETEALRRRVDLQIARIELDALAKTYQLTNAKRFINLLDVAGIARTQREAGGTGGSGGGADVELQIPIFDFGAARLRQAGETYMQAVNRLAEKAVNVRSQAREAYQRYRSSYAIASQYRARVLPLRKTIADETMLRYGAMQIDVFSLLTEAQRRISANIAAIEAQRSFWLASTNLDSAIVGGGIAEGDGAPRPAADQVGVTSNEQ